MSSSWSHLQPGVQESPVEDDRPEVLADAPVREATAAEIGERLRRARVDAGLSQTELAGEGMSASYVSRIEAGQRMPTRAVLEQLAGRLGCDVDYLLTGYSRDHEAELRLRLRYGQLALESGEAAEAEQQLRQLLAGDGLRGDMRVETLWALGRALEVLGRLEDAVVVLEEVRRLAAVGSDLWMQSVIALCRCYREAGDLSRAVDLGEPALAQIEALGLSGTDWGVRLTVTLLSVYAERGDMQRAAVLGREAIDRAEESGSREARAAAHWNAAMVAERQGRFRDAARWAERALALLSEGSDQRNLAKLRQAYADMLLRVDPPEPERAIELLDEAADVWASGAGSTIDLATGETEYANAYLLLGDLQAAEQHVDRALELLGGQLRLETAVAHAARGRIAFARDDRDAAVTAFRQAVGTLTGVESSRAAAVLWTEVGAMFDEIGDLAAARDAYRAANACLGLVASAMAVSSRSEHLSLPM